MDVRRDLRQSALRSIREEISFSPDNPESPDCSEEADFSEEAGISSSVGTSFTSMPLRCSCMCSISICSSRLNVPMRLNISSQSTSAPSNSGPSIHTNFVLPPMVRRQAPHIPVPSTMMVLSDTSVGMLYFWVSRQQNFIMMGGPMANTLSMCSWLISFSMPTVTTPFSP